MTQKSSSGKTPDSDREARLKAALKANLARRKQQARARTARGGDDAPNDKERSEDR